MSAPTVMNDGSVQYGSRVLSTGAAGSTVNYVAENLTINRPSKTIERTNEVDNPNGQVTYPTFVTGSATLQLADATTPEPQIGTTFNPITLDTAIGAETFYISEVGRVEAQGAEKKLNVTLRKKINP